MILVVHELDSAPVRQKILVGAKPIMVHAIRPYLYKHLSPSGSLYLQVQDADGRPIKDSESIAISAISGANYFHGYYRFLISVPLKAQTEYYIALKSTGGYTFDELAYIGWCNAFDLGNPAPASYDGARGMSAPLGMQIWAYEFMGKGDQ